MVTTMYVPPEREHHDESSYLMLPTQKDEKATEHNEYTKKKKVGQQ